MIDFIINNFENFGFQFFENYKIFLIIQINIVYQAFALFKINIFRIFSFFVSSAEKKGRKKFYILFFGYIFLNFIRNLDTISTRILFYI